MVALGGFFMWTCWATRERDHEEGRAPKNSKWSPGSLVHMPGKLPLLVCLPLLRFKLLLCEETPGEVVEVTDSLARTSQAKAGERACERLCSR